MSAPPPPSPAPKPGKVKVVRALYNYNAQAADELTFEEGDLLYIVDQVASKDWWKAKCAGKMGLVPSNYVGENTESIDNPLHEAARRGNIDFLRECIANQVSVNSLDRSGSTPLHWACQGGHLDCIDALLAGNPQLNVQNKLGDSPLHNASWKNHVEAIQKLLDRGASVDIKNMDGKKPIDMAHDAACLALLRSKMGLRPTSVDQDYGDEEDSD